jgi:hypothetical protein
MTVRRSAGFAAAGAALVMAACGSSSTSSNAAGGAAVQAAFANYGNQPSAHIKVVATGGSNPGSLDLDVTKDAEVGSGAFGGQTLSIIYAAGHGYAQIAAGGPWTQLPDDLAKPFKLFTIGTFSTCIGSLGSGSIAKFDQLVSSSATTFNGTAAIDYKATDGTGDIVISTGSNPLPLKLTTTGNGSSSSSSSSSTNPLCDVSSSSSSSTSSSSSSSNGGTTEVTWTYPGKVTTITPPPTTGSST